MYFFEKESHVFKKRSAYRSSGKRSSGVSALALLLFTGIVGAAVWFFIRDLSGPEITLDPPHSGRMGITQQVTVNAEDKSGIQALTVTVHRGSQSMVVVKEKYAELQKKRQVSFNLKDTKLPAGSFELEIKAQDGSFAGFGFGNSKTLRLPVMLDVDPPRIAVKTVAPAIRRGGAALIVYTTSEEVDKTGVQLGQMFFPAFRQPTGGYACLFPFPIKYRPAEYYPEITARDLAGNVTSSRLPIHAGNRVFRSDTLSIPDSFLNFKAAELAQICPEKTTPLEQYLCANSKERAADDAKLIELCTDTSKLSPTFLWNGRFLRLPRSAVKARYGDFRTYVDSNKQKIDEQTHMGIDFASIAKADVPASQSGKVAWVGYLGIHGNMVLIDHGLGLMTQYSHLSDILVHLGDDVQAGQIIGHTGTTGLAGGDHLHFGVLIFGVPVEPLEWLDEKWVKNNITNRLSTPL